MGAARRRPATFIFIAVFAIAPLASASSAAPPPPAAAAPSPAATTESRPRPLFEGVRPFVGVVTATGSGFVPDRSRVHPFPILRFAVTTGIYLGRTELGVEVAPFSQLYYFAPTLNAQAYAGYHLRLSNKLSWPIRAGVGVTWWIGYFLPQARADVLGLSMQSGRWLIDLQLPSLRVDCIPAKGGEKTNYWPSILFGAGFTLVP